MEAPAISRLLRLLRARILALLVPVRQRGGLGAQAGAEGARGAREMKLNKVEILAGIVLALTIFVFVYANLITFGIIELSSIELIAGIEVSLGIAFFGGWVIIGYTTYLLILHSCKRSKNV